MTTSLLRVALIALASAAIPGPALALDDVQVTSEAISRACVDVHHTPNAIAEVPTVRGPQDIVFNCRLVGSGFVTIAQLLPAEVCRRLTGNDEWYRGMGTQVFCRPGEATTTAPRSFTINADDIAKACRRVHRNPQASADPTTAGRYGLELNCRLVNENGVTLARVAPEDVCETKFGTREWIGIAGSTSFLCKGTPVEIAAEDRSPNWPPGGGAGGGGGGGGAPGGSASGDVPLTQEAMDRGCRILHGADSTAARLTHARATGQACGPEPVINCTIPVGIVSHDASAFCPTLSGTRDWYLTDFGRGTWLPGETPGAAPRVPVCRGSGALQYHALADIGRYCMAKGFRHANYGVMAQKPPVCFNPGAAPVAIAIGTVCREVHRADANEVRGVVYFCLPAGLGARRAAAG